MNGATFGALAAVRTLLDAGFKGRQAEAVAAVSARSDTSPAALLRAPHADPHR